ncbi:MAG: hypothetical protein KC996_04690 [Phycisphaerales bacterium]|nr:hypothetical protein [Phycisphaerales bacterium]
MPINPSSFASTGINSWHQAQSQLARSSERLATGLRINRGADDPAGLIASETLGARIAELDSLIVSTERANSQLSIREAELGVDDVSTVEERASIGLEQRANESMSRAMETERINTARARSVIRDADYARETSESVRASILGEASVRVMLIGRVQGQRVLDLLG